MAGIVKNHQTLAPKANSDALRLPVDRDATLRKLREVQDAFQKARELSRHLPQFDYTSTRIYHMCTNAMDAVVHAADLAEAHLLACIEEAGQKGKVDCQD